MSPWPMALLVRRQFAEAGAARAAILRPLAPVDIVTVLNQRYDAHPDALLDVYVPARNAAPGVALPAVVWTHGGGFVGGSKDEIDYYFRALADEGFTVVGVNYARAPGARYPTPVRRVFAALDYLQANAARLHIDATRLLLAGDSAGAQITAQSAAAVTNPEYAAAVGVSPTISAAQLRGVALCCGIYDLSGLGEGAFKDFITCAGWAYSGTRDFQSDEYFISTASVAGHVVEGFPASFITAGNADPLEPQSRALAESLRSKGVEVETLFYDAGHQPRLLHEYQFDLDLEDGRAALGKLVGFFSRCAEAGRESDIAPVRRPRRRTAEGRRSA